MTALPNLERRDLIVMGSSFKGREYVAMMRHYCGAFRRDWLMIPATDRPNYVRHGEVHHVRGGRIVQSNCLGMCWISSVRQVSGRWLPASAPRGYGPGPLPQMGYRIRPRTINDLNIL